MKQVYTSHAERAAAASAIARLYNMGLITEHECLHRIGETYVSGCKPQLMHAVEVYVILSRGRELLHGTKDMVMSVARTMKGVEVRAQLDDGTLDVPFFYN